MPPPNRLALDPYNSLYYNVPDPAALGPQYAPPMPLRQQVENVSAGLGRGVTTQLQDVQALLSDPRAYATNTLRGLRELVRNPALVGNVLRDTARRATSGPLGLGEVAGEMLPLGVRSRAPVRQDIDVYHGSPYGPIRGKPRLAPHDETGMPGFSVSKTPEYAKSYAWDVLQRHDVDWDTASPTVTKFKLKGKIEEYGKFLDDAAKHFNKPLSIMLTNEELFKYAKLKNIVAIDHSKNLGIDEISVLDPDALQKID